MKRKIRCAYCKVFLYRGTKLRFPYFCSLRCKDNYFRKKRAEEPNNVI